MTTESSALPEQSGQPDDRGATDQPGEGNDESQLVFPIVPTQAEVDGDEPTSTVATEVPKDNGGGLFPDQDAPYGRKADGTPKGRPGRPRKDAGQSSSNPQFERLDSVSQASALPPANSAAKPQVNKARSAISTDKVVVADYVAMGQLGANLWFNAGEMVFGPDWQPEPGEPAMVSGAFRNYFQAKEIKVLSPELVLLFTLGTYAMARMGKPTVRSKLSGMVEWVKSKIKR